MIALVHAWKYNRAYLLSVFFIPFVAAGLFSFAFHLLGFGVASIWHEPYAIAMVAWGFIVSVACMIKYHYSLNNNPKMAAKVVTTFQMFTITLVFAALMSH